MTLFTPRDETHCEVRRGKDTTRLRERGVVAVHTLQSMGLRRNALIDIFAGPRRDPDTGWVLNAAGYPTPES